MGCHNAHLLVTDLTFNVCSPTDPPSTCARDPRRWHRIEKELYLHTAQQSAWLYIAQVEEEELTKDDLVITDIRVGELSPSVGSNISWESRPGGIWVLSSNYTGRSDQAVTGIDVLFGLDVVDPRPEWDLIQNPLHLNAPSEVPVARLSVRHGRAKGRPDGPQTALRAKEDGKFKIVQISDTHMVTGLGVCTDTIDAHGEPLPESEADPRTIDFLGGILDTEKPDLVILTGDQVHHDIPDSQSAIFKVVAPLIERSIPYAAVFGNHDDEGPYALSHMFHFREQRIILCSARQFYITNVLGLGNDSRSPLGPRTAQMSLLQDLPFSLCQSGPEQVDGVGNYYLQVFDHEHSQLPSTTLYLLDSHGEIPSKIRNPDYDWIKQSQIDWFLCTSQALRKERGKDENHHLSHQSLAFMHIPLPEYGDNDLIIRNGHRREPTEGPSFNSHFYDTLAGEGVAAVGCGHDHVNDFCGQRPQQMYRESRQDGNNTPTLGPWLCYGGSSGFGGYGSYDGKRYHRRTRVWELDTITGGIRTWKRVEYVKERVDELVLVESDAVVATPMNYEAAHT